jgi:hypothetical protein
VYGTSKADDSDGIYLSQEKTHIANWKMDFKKPWLATVIIS